MRTNDQIILRRRAPFRFFSPVLILILAIILALLAGGWSVFWFMAAHETESLLQAWIEREKSVDRIWTCPDRQIAGYPFKIEIVCENAAFAGEILGKQLSGSLKGVYVTASLFQPDQINALMEPPFQLRSQDGEGEIALHWDAMRVHLNGLPQDVTAISIDGADVSLQGGIKGLGALAGRAGSVSSTVASVPERRAEDAYSFNLDLGNASIPVLDPLLGSAPPDAIKLDGTVTKADFRLGGTIAERLDHWRQAGGRLEVREASVTRGATKIAAHGALQLDDQHRPQGQLEGEFAGAEPLLRRFGINPAIVGAGSLLSSLLGGSKPNTAATNSLPSLHLPVTLRYGLIAVGPVKTSLAIPPLY